MIARLGPTLIKYLLNCSARSNLLVNVLLFIVILEGEVCPFAFRLIKVPMNFHVAFKLLLSRLNLLRWYTFLLKIFHWLSLFGYFFIVRYRDWVI